MNQQFKFGWAVCVFVTLCGGCHSLQKPQHDSLLALQRPVVAPRELCKATLPTYRIEPPDILDIEAVRLVPRESYRLSSTDVLQVQVRRTSYDRLVAGDVLSVRIPGAPTVDPIDGNFVIQADGSISLGTTYGTIHVEGLNLEGAREKIETTLSNTLVAPDTYVALAEAGVAVDAEFTIEIDGTIDFGYPYGRVNLRGTSITEARDKLTEHFGRSFDNPYVIVNLLQASLLQLVVGEHLVGPDGSVTLGIYGSVQVVGLTLEEASGAIEEKLSVLLDQPKVATSVLSYNSKVYYVIAEGAGFGEGVFKFPVTGNDTVLDALAQIEGLPQGSSSKMWIARPSPISDDFQLLPIDWGDLTSLAATNTNYQLLPGDRLFITRDPLIALNSNIAKLINPIERVFGFSILGAETATRLSGEVLRGGGNPLGRGF